MHALFTCTTMFFNGCALRGGGVNKNLLFTSFVNDSKWFVSGIFQLSMKIELCTMHIQKE